MTERPRPYKHLYGRRWQNARLAHLREHPLCVMCRREGLIVPATVVDHITPHKGDLALFWDRSGNWQSLCAHHHNRDKQAEERGGKVRRRIGLDGYPIVEKR